MDYNEWEPCEALYLDDCRKVEDNHFFKWVTVRSYEEFCRYITANGLPKMLSFDHDLGQKELRKLKGRGKWIPRVQWAELPTGMDCAKWLVNYCLDNNLKMPHFTVHSQNPVGGDNILSLLNQLQHEQGQTPNGYRTAW